MAYMAQKGIPMTDTFNYQELAAKTVSPNFFIDRVPVGTLARALHQAKMLLGDGSPMSAIKRTIMYGAELPGGLPTGPDTIINKDAVPVDVFHAIIGILTEAGELAQALFDVLFETDTPPFDVVNFSEEMGDIGWYRSLGLRAVGKTPDECDRENIAKLMKRFRDRYTDEEVINRNVAAERETLEGFTAELRGISIVEYGPGHTRVRGEIYGDKQGRFPDGKDVTTTRVVSIDQKEDFVYVTTQSGNVYKIQNVVDDVDPEIVKLFGLLATPTTLEEGGGRAPGSPSNNGVDNGISKGS